MFGSTICVYLSSGENVPLKLKVDHVFGHQVGDCPRHFGRQDGAVSLHQFLKGAGRQVLVLLAPKNGSLDFFHCHDFAPSRLLIAGWAVGWAVLRLGQHDPEDDGAFDSLDAAKVKVGVLEAGVDEVKYRPRADEPGQRPLEAEGICKLRFINMR